MRGMHLAQALRFHWHRHWKMELFTMLQLFLVLLLVTLICTTQTHFFTFRWLEKLDTLSYVNGLSGESLFETVAESDIRGMAASWQVNVVGNELSASEIDYGFSQHIEVPLRRGNWFVSGAGSQVIISYELRELYEIGKTYPFELYRYVDEASKTVSAKVVGYLSDEGFTVDAEPNTGGDFAGVFTQGNAMMFCTEKVNPIIIGSNYTRYFALVNTPAHLQEEDETTQTIFRSLKDNYQIERDRNKDNIVLYVYLLAAIVALSLLTVCTNAIVNGDKTKRMRAICILSGQTQSGLIVSAIVRGAAEFLAAALVGLAVVLIVDALVPAMVMTLKFYWIGFFVIFAVSAVITLLEAIAVRRLQPLNVLQRD